MVVGDKFDKIMESMLSLESKIMKLKNSKSIDDKSITEKKNYPLHLMIEKSLMINLKKEANENGISVAEYCRRKLKSNNQLDRIELKIDKLISKLN